MFFASKFDINGRIFIFKNEKRKKRKKEIKLVYNKILILLKLKSI